MVNSKRSAYLDNAATTYPKPEEVYRAVESFMRDVGGSAGRSGHRRSVEAGRLVYEARAAVAEVLGVSDPLRVVFTRNATEALNIAIRGLVKPGDHVVTSSMEHNSVMRPLEALRREGVEYTVVRCREDGALDPGDVEKELRSGTAMVVLSHASNVTGTILPVEDVAEMTSSRGIKLLVDGAQTVGRLPLDLSRGVDLLAFSGHKELFGPQGTGVLWLGEGVELRPLCYGGTGTRSEELRQPGELPERLESGTLNAPGIVGLGAGARFVASRGIGRIREQEVERLERMVDGLGRIQGVRAYGPADQRERVGIVPVAIEGRTCPQAAELLDVEHDIAVRAGLHCSPAAHRTIGTLETGALRISLSLMNTDDDVDYFLECLRAVAS